MANNLQRPKFLPSLFKTIGTTLEARGALRSAPWWLLACCATGGLTSYLIPRDFYDRLEISVVVYVGILTLNALILALSWSAFARIHELLTGDRFSSYLLEAGLLNDYIVYI